MCNFRKETTQMGWKGNRLDGFVRAGFYLSIENHPVRQYYARLRCSKTYC